jgi:hypothetical protein
MHYKKSLKNDALGDLKMCKDKKRTVFAAFLNSGCACHDSCDDDGMNWPVHVRENSDEHLRTAWVLNDPFADMDHSSFLDTIFR